MKFLVIVGDKTSYVPFHSISCFETAADYVQIRGTAQPIACHPYAVGTSAKILKHALDNPRCENVRISQSELLGAVQFKQWQEQQKTEPPKVAGYLGQARIELVS